MKSRLCVLLSAIIFLVGCGSDSQLSQTMGLADPVPSEGVSPTARDTIAYLAGSYWVVDDSSGYNNEFEPFIGFVGSEIDAEALSLVGSDGCNGFGASLDRSNDGGYVVANGHATEVLCLDFDNTGLIAAIIESGPLGLEMSDDGESLTLARAGGILFSRVEGDPRR